MAFLQSSGTNNYFFLDRYVGSQGNIKEWVYITVDTPTTVMTAGYFATLTGTPPNPGDTLRILHCTNRDILSTIFNVTLLVVESWSSSIYTRVNDNGVGNAAWFGVVGDGTTDDQPALQAAHNACDWLFIPKPSVAYRLNTPLILRSNTRISGIRGGTKLRQYGTAMFTCADDLTDCTVEQLYLDYRNVSPSVYHCAFQLASHNHCKFTDLDFYNYDSSTIIERIPTSAATSNTFDNYYARWFVNACAVLDLSQGLEGTYYRFVGDGSTTVINTGIAWPEQFNSSVIVFKEEGVGRVYTQLTLTTDYTVSYPSGLLRVTLTSPAASTARIHIWPASPLTTGNRRPISNDIWERIATGFVYSRGHLTTRWVDSQTYRTERIRLSAAGAKGYQFNPGVNRSQQGGDYSRFDQCIITYNTVSDSTNLIGIDMGPGSNNMIGTGVVFDNNWLDGATNGLTYRDGHLVNLTGTVATTSGSAIVTGTSTKFQDELTLIGATQDIIQINGILKSIQSIDSNTQITLTTAYGATLSGQTAQRLIRDAGISYDMQFAKTGDSATADHTKMVGHRTLNSLALRTGTATLLSGTTSIVVTYSDITHYMLRQATANEILVTPQSNLSGTSFWISAITGTTFTISVSAAAGSNLTFSWRIELE